MIIDGYELKPCPFCGKDTADFTTAKELEKCSNFDDDDMCPVFEPQMCLCKSIVCNVWKGGCGASIGYTWDIEKAVAMWNSRADGGDDRK